MIEEKEEAAVVAAVVEAKAERGEGEGKDGVSEQ